MRMPTGSAAMNPVIGLTGGIGSGKSTVADLFYRLGVTVVDTDRIAHELTGAEGAAMPEIIAAFDTARRGQAAQPDMTGWAAEGMVNGYWFGEPGIASHHRAAVTQLQIAQLQGS